MPERNASGNWIAVAFDFGRRRIGIAAGDSITRRARPVTTLRSGAAGVDWPGVDRVVSELKPGILVVGVPLNVDGSPGELTVPARAFARELEQRLHIQTATVDERWSSLEASAQLKEARRTGRRARRVRKEDVDAAAACIILERWFDAPTRNPA